MKITQHKQCQVHNCYEIAEYYNPDSKLKYCENHYEKLGGKIIYQTANPKHNQKEISVRLIPIENKFNLMEV